MRFLRRRTGKIDEERVVAELLLTVVLEAVFHLIVSVIIQVVCLIGSILFKRERVVVSYHYFYLYKISIVISNMQKTMNNENMKKEEGEDGKLKDDEQQLVQWRTKVLID